MAPEHSGYATNSDSESAGHQAILRQEQAVALAHADDEFVRRSFHRASDPVIRRLRRSLPPELGGERMHADPHGAIATATAATWAHLREAGLMGPASESALRDAS